MPLTLEQLDLDRHGDADAAIVAYPHGAAAPVVAALRAKGSRSSTSAPTSACATSPSTSTGTSSTRTPSSLGEAVYGLPERYREAVRDAGLVANPGCYPTATILALAPLAATSPTSSSMPNPASRAPGAAPESTHFVAADENVTPYGVGAHRHMPEIDQELHAAGAPRHLGSRSRRTCCRSTRASSSPAT